MFHLRRLNKIKLEDVIAILPLSLFLVEVINILYTIWNINSLNFQHVTTYLFKGFKQKNSLSLYTFVINTLVIKIDQWNIIAYIRVSTPPQKHHRPLFCQAALNWQPIQAPFFS